MGAIRTGQFFPLSCAAFTFPLSNFPAGALLSFLRQLVPFLGVCFQVGSSAAKRGRLCARADDRAPKL